MAATTASETDRLKAVASSTAKAITKGAKQKFGPTTFMDLMQNSVTSSNIIMFLNFQDLGQLIATYPKLADFNLPFALFAKAKLSSRNLWDFGQLITGLPKPIDFGLPLSLVVQDDLLSGYVRDHNYTIRQWLTHYPSLSMLRVGATSWAGFQEMEKSLDEWSESRRDPNHQNFRQPFLAIDGPEPQLFEGAYPKPVVEWPFGALSALSVTLGNSVHIVGRIMDIILEQKKHNQTPFPFLKTFSLRMGLFIARI